jgi:L-threonylcarbamoyladenylate synthase
MPPPAVARVFRGTAKNLAFLARRLRAGDLVAVPTETVYGLAANALDAAACRRIFRAKNRPLHDPLIVHIHSPDQLARVCTPNAAARRLARQFWPGPLTLVLPKTDAVPDIVSGGRDSVAVRMPSHPLLRRLLKLAGVPLAAPSANPFGYVSPTTAGHVRDGLGRKIRFVLDGGPAKIGLESTIVDLRDPAKPVLLRPGAITREALSRALGRPVRTAARRHAASAQRPALAPGMLARHYSPRTPLFLHETIGATAIPTHAYLFIRKPAGRTPRNVFWLDAQGDLRRAAHRLFGLLRRLDAAGFAAIHAEIAPGDGLADAINDRLRRAAAR